MVNDIILLRNTSDICETSSRHCFTHKNGNKATSLPSKGSSERVFPEKVQKQSKGYGFIILAKSKSE